MNPDELLCGARLYCPVCGAEAIHNGERYTHVQSTVPGFEGVYCFDCLAKWLLEHPWWLGQNIPRMVARGDHKEN